MITSRHPEWPEFKKSLEARIEELRRELEQARPEHETAALRGGIGELRRLILEIEPPQIDAPQPDYNSSRAPI